MLAIVLCDVDSFSYARTDYANPHAVTGIGTTTYAYDNNGNLTGDGLWTHTWNYRNRLTESDDGTHSFSYAYDPNNSRVKQDGISEIRYYAGKLYDTDGTTPRKHVFLPNGTLIATIEDSEPARKTIREVENELRERGETW